MSRWNSPITPGNSRVACRIPFLALGSTPRAMFVLLFTATLSAPCAPSWGGEEARERPFPALSIAAPKPQPVVGERLSFHGRWLGIPVGHGWIEVKEIVEREGRRAYHIEAQGRSNDVLSTFYPIHDSVESYLDVETLQPIYFEKHQREGNYRADEAVTFDYTTSTATYRSLLNNTVKQIPLPPRVQDLVSAFYWLRAQPIPPNETIQLNIYTDEKIYQTQIQIKQLELLELLKRGTFPCIVAEPKASFKGLLVKRGRLWAYVTADEYRLPLMVRVTTPWGPMTAILDEASIPAGMEGAFRPRRDPTAR